MSGLKKLAKKSVKFVFGGGIADSIFGKKKKSAAAPAEENEIVMPDEEALRLAARKRGAIRARRSGRVSTILDEETLG